MARFFQIVAGLFLSALVLVVVYWQVKQRSDKALIFGDAYEGDSQALLNARRLHHHRFSFKKVVHDADKGVSKVGKGIDHDFKKGTQAVVNSAKKTEHGLIVAGDAAKNVAESTLKELGHVFSPQTFKNVGKKINDAAQKFEKGLEHVAEEAAKDVKALGPLIVSAVEASEEVMKAFSQLIDLGACFDFKKIMCEALLPMCDCNAGSEVSVSLDKPPKIEATCVPKYLAKGLAWQTEGQWPGQIGTEEPASENDDTDEAPELEKKMSVVSTDGDYSLKVAVDSHVDFIPKTVLSLQTDGQLKASISGSVVADLSARAEAEAKFSYTRIERLPVDPLTYTACADVFCITFLLQANATLDLETSAEGVAEVMVSAQYDVEADISIDVANGQIKANVKSSPFTHSESVTMDGSFDGRLSLSLMPELTILPLPGAPISVKPFLTGEIQTHVEASATVSLAAPAPGFLKTMSSGASADFCVAADVNVKAGVMVDGLGIPQPLQLSSDQIKGMITKAIDELPQQLIDAIDKQLESCAKLGKTVDKAISKPIQEAAKLAAKGLDDVIPNFKVSLPSPENLLDKQFCKTVLQKSYPENDAQCSKALTGCSA